MDWKSAQVFTRSPASAEGSCAPIPGPRWFALSVTVRHEKIVSQLLHNKGMETFLPLYTRRHQYARRIREFELPLFPGYLFCRSDPTVRLPILTTPGVQRIIGAGRNPIPLEDSEINSLQRAADAGISMVPHPYWHSGQKGRIAKGPLAGLEGTVVNAKDSIRLVLSVGLLQRSVLLEIDAECVTLVEGAPGRTLI
ncbi:MAG TPA: transcription termination/antitermination NusG family protein [Bryobacteraceae bacterium]|nr:transcription termination/antitermination NusG family protein [Bryobacteraceae bacterium]